MFTDSTPPTRESFLLFSSEISTLTRDVCVCVFIHVFIYEFIYSYHSFIHFLFIFSSETSTLLCCSAPAVPSFICIMYLCSLFNFNPTYPCISLPAPKLRLCSAAPRGFIYSCIYLYIYIIYLIYLATRVLFLLFSSETSTRVNMRCVCLFVSSSIYLSIRMMYLFMSGSSEYINEHTHTHHGFGLTRNPCVFFFSSETSTPLCCSTRLYVFITYLSFIYSYYVFISLFNLTYPCLFFFISSSETSTLLCFSALEAP